MPLEHPNILHHLALDLLMVWKRRLMKHELDGHPQFDNASRLQPMLFMACERLRIEEGRTQPVVFAPGRFLDWQSHASLTLFQSEFLRRTLEAMRDAGLVEIDLRFSANFEMTDKGAAVLRKARDLNARPRNGDAWIGDPAVRDAVHDTVRTCALLHDRDFRDYLIGFSMRLRAEEADLPHITFDKRYESVTSFKVFEGSLTARSA